MKSRVAVFLSVLMVSLVQPAFPYVWAATAPSPGGLALVSAAPERLSAIADVRFSALQTVVRSRAEHLSMRDRLWAETRLEEASLEVDRKANRDPKGIVQRLAKEFAVEPQILLHKKHHLGAWWSEMVIVHTILANIPSGIEPDEILLLRKAGASWSEIAYGLGFELKPFVSAALAECRVAAGEEAPDGKIMKLERDADAPLVLDDDGVS